MVKQRIDKQQVREIAENAFKAHFSDFEIIRIDVEPMIDHDGDRIVDVNIYCDGNYKKLHGAGRSRVHSEIASKTWYEVEDDLGFPLVHFYSKSTLKQHDLAKSKRIRRSSSNSQPKQSAVSGVSR